MAEQIERFQSRKSAGYSQIHYTQATLLEEATLEEATLEEATLEEATLEEATLEEATEARLPNAVLDWTSWGILHKSVWTNRARSEAK